MTVKRGTTNRNARGSSSDRRKRREWLVAEWGNGVTVLCCLGTAEGCLRILTVDTVTADRIVPGCEGGRYVRENIQPACSRCNASEGGHLGAKRRLALSILDDPCLL